MRKVLFIAITFTIVNAQELSNLFLSDWQLSLTTSFIETGSVSIHKKLYKMEFENIKINFVSGPNIFIGNLGSKKDIYFEYDVLSRISCNIAEKIEIGSDVGVAYRYIADGYETKDGIRPKIGFYAGYKVNNYFMMFAELKGMWFGKSDYLSISSAGVGLRWEL